MRDIFPFPALLMTEDNLKKYREKAVNAFHGTGMSHGEDRASPGKHSYTGVQPHEDLPGAPG
jgi:hypothetical protein